MTLATVSPDEDAPVLVVGAGLSGAVVARTLAEAGLRVRVIDKRPHVAGNCHTERDPRTGILMHVYGPHIFHTDDAEVWDYVTRFDRFRPYRHRVMAQARGRVWSLPMNLLTINQFFGRTLSPDEARAFLATQSDSTITAPQSFEDQALSVIGRDLYETFFEGYTRKQWGIEPRDLPASVLRRLPVRFDYDDSYFCHRFQGMPESGYTVMVERILSHPAISLTLSTPFQPAMTRNAAHVFWSGPLDDWFGCDIGRLGYRTLDFDHRIDPGDGQGCAVMNYCDAGVPWTRITEHRHFAPWETHPETVLTRETARDCGPDDIPFYPIRLVAEKDLLRRYVERASSLVGVTFMGRLGTYRYIDMDVTIREALETARAYLSARGTGAAMPPFVTAPISSGER